MKKVRGTPTVRREILTAAEPQVPYGRARSGSEEKAGRDELVRLLAKMRAENGPASDEEEAWARGVLGL